MLTPSDFNVDECTKVAITIKGLCLLDHSKYFPVTILLKVFYSIHKDNGGDLNQYPTIMF